MNDTRARFEEIWPVPEGIRWMPHCGYAPDIGVDADSVLDDCVELDLRLDTFTRCQETMGQVMSLVDELIKDLEEAYDEYTDVHGDMAITKAKAWLRSNK